MFYRVLGLLSLLMSLGLLTSSVLAQTDTCIQVNVFFRASQSTTLDGKVSVNYTDAEGNNVQFIDFHITDSDRVIRPGSDFLIGSFTVSGYETLRVTLDDDQLDVSGKGRLFTTQTDCGIALPSNDGRLNLDDPASLSIVYTDTSTDGYAIYAVDPTTGKGILAIRASGEEVDAALSIATAPSGTNTLIAESGDTSLWALTSGECQMNSLYADGKPDVFVFDCA
jgi:hypothetical protein